ncbi:hypothetical protein WAK64_10465 [Bacillus spongiae]|uniref:DUF5673 domain-containing protein n=1 Tax=Bacillus spongiae TaxID=2683610 RepID=A0ABU8HDR9_9BACI
MIDGSSLLYAFYVLLFTGVCTWLIYYQYQIRKAMQLTEEALFPQKDQYEKVLTPYAWTEMRPLTKDAKSYKYYNWLTVVIVLLLIAMFYFVFIDKTIQGNVIVTSYLLLSMTNLIRLPASFYLIPNGLILNGFFYPWSKINSYEVERIVKWHSMYGLHEKINNGYCVRFQIKKRWLRPQPIVISDYETFHFINNYLIERGIIQKEAKVKKNEVV